MTVTPNSNQFDAYNARPLT